MAPPDAVTVHWPDPRALGSRLDEPLAGRLAGDDMRTLRTALERATRRVTAVEDMLVADGLPLGRLLPHGTVALYRPDPTAPLGHRVLEVDPGGAVIAALNRGPRGSLREAWVRLGDGSAAGILPGGADHPLWGASDRLVHAGVNGVPTPLTVAGRVAWDAVDTIPPVAEPGRLPSG